MAGDFEEGVLVDKWIFKAVESQERKSGRLEDENGRKDAKISRTNMELEAYRRPLSAPAWN
jgi:hypothetical protein